MNSNETLLPAYQAPELVELGDASTLTLGTRGTGCDSCDCAKTPFVEELGSVQ